jgi:hypothetical protein
LVLTIDGGRFALQGFLRTTAPALQEPREKLRTVLSHFAGPPVDEINTPFPVEFQKGTKRLIDLELCAGA